MTEIVKGVPENWATQVTRAYAVMATPSPFLVMTTLDDAYHVEPFSVLYEDVLADGDEYGAAWLTLRALDDLDAVLEHEDELGLREWLERLHPRGKGGLFREVRGRVLADKADRALRTYLETGARKPGAVLSREMPYGAHRGFHTLPRRTGENYGRPDITPQQEHDIQVLRGLVQQMVDEGAPIKEIRRRLGLGDPKVRERNEQTLKYRDETYRRGLEEAERKLEYVTDPGYRQVLEQERDRYRDRLARQIHRPRRPRTQPPPVRSPMSAPLRPLAPTFV